MDNHTFLTPCGPPPKTRYLKFAICAVTLDFSAIWLWQLLWIHMITCTCKLLQFWVDIWTKWKWKNYPLAGRSLIRIRKFYFYGVNLKCKIYPCFFFVLLYYYYYFYLYFCCFHFLPHPTPPSYSFLQGYVNQLLVQFVFKDMIKMGFQLSHLGYFPLKEWGLSFSFLRGMN